MKEKAAKFKEWYLKQDVETQAKVGRVMVGEQGVYERCTGCEQTSTYGACYLVNGDCVWIPLLG